MGQGCGEGLDVREYVRQLFSFLRTLLLVTCLDTYIVICDEIDVSFRRIYERDEEINLSLRCWG